MTGLQETADLSFTLPQRGGAGLKPEHYTEILSLKPDVGFFEIHAENYMGAGGAPHHYLERIRADYPISLHGVGLSIGGDGPLDEAHLARLKHLCERYEPASFSEHLAWSSHDTVFLNDLLPLPYTQARLDVVCDHIDRVQEVLGRRMLLENPSTYVAFASSEMDELSFLAGIVRRTGCGLLLDVNNVHVSAVNHRRDARDYLSAFPIEHVGEIHLGGHAPDTDDEGGPLLIDAHDREVDAAVWSLFADLMARTGPLPVLIEWDNNVPSWPVLLGQVQEAEQIMAQLRHEARPQGLLRHG